MLDCLKDQLYPCLLVTKIDIYKVSSPLVPLLTLNQQIASVSNPKDQEAKLINFFGRSDIDSQSLWEFARNIVWTYNTDAIKALLNDEPKKAFKLLRSGLKLLDNKDPNLDWRLRDEWRLLRIITLRNIVYYYCRKPDYQQALHNLEEIEMLQLSLGSELQSKIDLDSPLLMLAFLNLVMENSDKAEYYSRNLVKRDSDNQGKAEFFEEKILRKNDDVHKLIAHFILGKCFQRKQMYKEALGKYKQGSYLLKSNDIFPQSFKDAILIDYKFFKKQIAQQQEQQMQAFTAPENQRTNTSIRIENKNYPRITINPIQFARELRPKSTKSDSSGGIVSPPQQFSFGDLPGGHSPQHSGYPLSIHHHKRKSTARFERVADKLEIITDFKDQVIETPDPKENLNVIKLPETQTQMKSPDANRRPSLNFKMNNLVDKITPRPQMQTQQIQIGTFNHMPSIILSSEVAPNSATSRKSHRDSLKSLFPDQNKLSSLMENVDSDKTSQIQISKRQKPISFIEKPPREREREKDKSKEKEKEKNGKISLRADLSKSNVSDADDLVELVEHMEGEKSLKQSSRVNENDTINLSGTKFESQGTFVASLSSVDVINDFKVEKEERTIKPFRPATAPRRLEDRFPDEFSGKPIEIRAKIRHLEMKAGIIIQRWGRRIILRYRLKNLLGEKNYNILRNLSIKNDSDASKIRRQRKVLQQRQRQQQSQQQHQQTISHDTLTQSEDAFTSKDSHMPPTLSQLQRAPSSSFPLKKTPSIQANIILSESPLVTPIPGGGHFTWGKSGTQLLPEKIANSEVTSRVTLHNTLSQLIPNDFSPIEIKKDNNLLRSKFDDKKGVSPSPSISDTSTIKSKTRRKTGRKYRPGFKETLNNEANFTRNNYLRSRSSLHRSKSFSEKSFVKYESRKLPDELNETEKLKVMRKYADLKDLKNVPLKFHKAAMSNNEIWFFKYKGNSWQVKSDDKKDLILHLELSNTSRRSVDLRIPLCCEDEHDTENRYITVWPIISPSIQNWFKEQKFEDEFDRYQSKVLSRLPKRMYRRVEKAMTLYGLKGPSKLGSEDKRSFHEIQKRLLFLIDKKVIAVSKLNGKSLFLVQTSLGEKLKFLQQKRADAKEAEKRSIRALATYTESNIRIPRPKSVESMKEMLEFERECLEEMNRVRMVRKLKFPDDRIFDPTAYSLTNIFSQEIIFKGIIKLKQFYWVYIISRCSENKNSRLPDQKQISIILDTMKKNLSMPFQNKKDRKFFVFTEEEFLSKCADFLEITSVQPESLKRTNFLKAELSKRLHRMIVDQGDVIKLSPEFQKEETEDDPFAKTISFYRAAEKSSFQEFKFEKPVAAMTDKDSLFDKNFKEIYSKYFNNQTQKYFTNENYNTIDIDSNIVEDSSNNFMFKQKYIEDDEAIATNKTATHIEPETLDATFLLKREGYSKLRYYFAYKFQGTLCYIRLKCNRDLAGKEYINISYYHPNREQINYTNISDEKLLRKIKSTLDTTSPALQLRSLKSLILYGISSIGRVLQLKSTSYDVNQIQRKYAIPANPSYLKVEMLNQSTNLESAFEMWTCYFIHKFEESLGKCYVKLHVYRKKVLIMTDKITPDMNVYHFSFEICPAKSKTKQYRLLLNSYDLKAYLNIKIESDSSYYFMKLSRSVLDKFIIWKRFTARILALPISRTIQEVPDNPHLHVFYNTFSMNTFETKVKINNDLEAKNYAPKILYQGVRKFNGKFYMITVEYVHRFDYWNIHVYNPKTSRNFVCIVFFEEMLNWRNSFLKKIYPSFLNELKRTQFKTYQDFMVTYLKYLKRAKKKSQLKFTSAVDIPSSKRIMFTPMTPSEVDTLNRKEKQLFFKIDKVYSLPFLRRKKDPSKSFSSRHNLDKDDITDQIDFYEFKFWESVVKNMTFETDRNGRDIIKIDNFEGNLSELIFTSVLQIDKSVDSLIEIHIENNHEKKFLDSASENITYLSSINNILYIKIFFFNLVICQREKLNLREIINLNIADGLYKYQANYIDSKMNLADIQNICGYIIHKIKSSNLLTLLNETPLFSKRFSLQQKSEYRIKIKSNALTEPDDNIEEKKGFFLFKKIINTKPFISASAYYDKHRETFLVYLYRFSDCALVVKEYKVKQVKKKIPLVTNYMEGGLYGLVGSLIIEANENFLKIYAAYTYNILEMFKNK